MRRTILFLLATTVLPSMAWAEPAFLANSNALHGVSLLADGRWAADVVRTASFASRAVDGPRRRDGRRRRGGRSAW